MNKIITILIAVIAIAGLVLGIVAIRNIQFGQRFGASNNVFPTTLNDWEDDDIIESGWADSLEAKIGVDSSTVNTSLDYQTRNASSKLGSIYNTATTSDYVLVADGRIWNSTSSLVIDNTGYIGISSTTPSNTFSVTGNSRMSGTLTVTGVITGSLTGNVTGNSDTATALAADPTDCSNTTNLFSKGIGANGSSTCAFVTLTSADIPLTSKYMLVGNASNVASSTSAMIIDSNGYVGIATTTPTKGFSVGTEAYFGNSVNFWNTTTTFDRPPSVADGPNATSTGFYSLAKMGDITSRIAFPNALATSTGALNRWYDEDLSDIVGSGQAMVYLKLYNSGSSTVQAGARTNGDDTGTADLGDGLWIATIEVNKTAYLMAITDASGIIEVYNSYSVGAADKITFTVMAYIK